MLAVTSTLGVSIPVGINIGVINAPTGYIKSWCNLTIFERYDTVMSPGDLDTFFSVVVSIFLIGGVVGSLGGAALADKFGRLLAVQYSYNLLYNAYEIILEKNLIWFAAFYILQADYVSFSAEISSQLNCYC